MAQSTFWNGDSYTNPHTTLGTLGVQGFTPRLRISFTRAPRPSAAGAVGAEGAPVQSHPLFRLPAHGFRRELARAQRYGTLVNVRMQLLLAL